MLLAEVRVFISHECHCSPRKSSSDVKLPCDFTNAGVHFSQSPFRGRGGASNVRALCGGVGRVGGGLRSSFLTWLGLKPHLVLLGVQWNPSLQLSGSVAKCEIPGLC